jgi:ABC-type multidrug transport system fused ATPase/permease subunit
MRVGKGGRVLSGGQQQCVTIACALLWQPQVLLLDELTAMLDLESECKVVKASKKAMEETSCMVMVTHRLGVI